MISVTSGKGFHIGFENGYTVSVQLGGGNYCDNYDHPIGGTDPPPPSTTAEVAVFQPGGDLMRLPGWDDTVQGWQSPEQILALLNTVASWEGVA